MELGLALIGGSALILAGVIPAWINVRRTNSPNGKRIGQMVYETNVAVADLADAFQEHIGDPKAHEDVSVGELE